LRERHHGDGPCGRLPERGDETETREEAHRDSTPHNVNFLDQKSKVKSHLQMYYETKRNETTQSQASVEILNKKCSNSVQCTTNDYCQAELNFEEVDKVAVAERTVVAVLLEDPIELLRGERRADAERVARLAQLQAIEPPV
jgi:hypothetical protein